MARYVFPNTHMSHTHPKQGKEKEQWYDVDVVVELLIHETPRGETYAPEIGNLCVGFTHLSPEKLGEEITDMRAHWPFIFPKTLSTEDLLKLVRKKYSSYEEIVTLQNVE